MKMVKNIAVVAFAASFMFAGVGFHMANNYTNMDDGVDIATSYGVTYDLNGQTSVGWDSNLGMMMYFAAPAGTSLRLGWVADDPADATDATAAKTSMGLGFTWWNGGDGLKTSISTNYDYIMQGALNSTNLSVTVGFGF
tara:strand:+ start:213 stop:629 length:417 start_codon:yes stop_codon:yes gene_type:complete